MLQMNQQRVQSYLPVDLRFATRFAEVYGWRMQSEILTREWRHIDLSIGTVRLEPGTTKNDDGRTIYLIYELKLMFVEQLARVRALEQKLGRVIPYVFPHLEGRFQGERIQDFKKAWKTACKKARCPGMLRHDFRRTAVRNLTRAHVIKPIAKQITGHRSDSVYDRYDIVADEELISVRDILETHSSLIVGAEPSNQEPVNG
jgi:integrase